MHSSAKDNQKKRSGPRITIKISSNGRYPWSPEALGAPTWLEFSSLLSSSNVSQGWGDLKRMSEHSLAKWGVGRKTPLWSMQLTVPSHQGHTSSQCPARPTACTPLNQARGWTNPLQKRTTWWISPQDSAEQTRLNLRAQLGSVFGTHYWEVPLGVMQHKDARCKEASRKGIRGSSLVAQWLRLHVPNAGGQGSIPGQGTRPYMPQLLPSAAK